MSKIIYKQKCPKEEKIMKTKILTPKCQSLIYSSRGFTLIEVLIGATIMLLVVLATLSLYVRSNKLSVDQMQFASLQHDVRSAMFFISRDVRSAGVGLRPEISGYFLEGIDGFGPSPESPDSVKIMGDFDDPLHLTIQHQGGNQFKVDMSELYNYPYQEAFYQDREVIIISPTCPGCFALRYIGNISWPMGVAPGTFTMPPGRSELNPPGGLMDTGCPSNCWDDAICTFIQIKQYWLDTTGNPGDYPSLNLTVGQDGYLGLPYTLYLTRIDAVTGSAMHMPIAFNVENLQFQYIGDFDYDGLTDPSTDWDNANWTINPGDDAATKQAKYDLITRIRMVRICVLGRTENPYVSVSGTPSSGISVYRRPAIANSPASSQDDRHRRFLLESTSNVRNLSLNLYNTGNVY
ncbi:MAG: prepilin-type N-terminal cleavage/methylation domain-containing protein [Candidatus Aminicenantes bacterium]|nr:prepilin-type N-terminal cleavage/methylation domain-containing protein [Candidatus Aminicenantes bacterium]